MTSSAIAKANRAVTTALRRRRIALVQIDYDGEGDNGQIENIWATDAATKAVSLDLPITLALYPDKPPTRYASLREALEEFAWLLLQTYHDGYENDDGGLGAIVIEVRKSLTTIDHNDRVTELVNTYTEV